MSPVLRLIGVPVLCLVVPTLIRAALGIFVPDELFPPFSAYYPAILIAAVISGTTEALLVALLAAVVVWTVFPTTYLGPQAPVTGQVVNLAFFLAASAAIILIARSYRLSANYSSPPSVGARAYPVEVGHSALTWLDAAGMSSNSLRASLFAVACVAIATLIRMGFAWVSGGETLLFAPYYPAILIVTLMCGPLVGGFAVALSLVVVWWAFVPPEYGFEFPSHAHGIAFIFFMAMSTLMIFVADAYRQAIKKILEQAREKELLVRELEHRSKNTLMVVQAIVLQTLRDNRAEANKIIGRIMALIAADQLLTVAEDFSADFRDILNKELGPYGTNRAILHGSSMRLNSQLARMASLIIHELATNAVKYGALSTAEGKIKVTWFVAANRAHVRWEESEGPPVAPPKRKGFGTELITSLLAANQGKVESEWRPEGVVHEISFVLLEPVSNPSFSTMAAASA